MIEVARTEAYFTEPGAVNATETGLALANTTMKVTQEWLDGKWQ